MSKKIVFTSGAPKAIGPYSQAVIANGFLFISGQLPINSKTGEMPSEVKDQAKQCMENIKAILKEANCEFDSIVRCGIFLSNLEDFAVVNEVYGSYFTSDFPARATVQVARIPKDAKVEIEAIAILK